MSLSPCREWVRSEVWEMRACRETSGFREGDWEGVEGRDGVVGVEGVERWWLWWWCWVWPGNG